ncbi:CoA transferase [Streptomyces sp. HNM0574]|nr:CoA transferase [Streptomyces sp. HNM0574]
MHPRTTRDEVTARLLRHTAHALRDDALTAAVDLAADRAGPVAAPLPDERAVQAACGIAHVHGRAAGRPLPLAVDYAATAAGLLAAQGVSAVLLARHRGLGLRHVRTSEAQAALLATGQYLAAATAAGDGEEETAAGPVPRTAGLAAADGTPVEIETLDPDAWREFWRRLGVAPSLAGRGWGPFQRRFATAVCDLPDALRQAARETTLAALRDAAAATGVSLLPLTGDPAPAGLPSPWDLTREPGPATGHGPGPGLPHGALPLAGVRVVEATRRVQGPLAGHVLRLLGAEVIRVEPPGGDPMRGLPPLAGDCSARFLALNAGKSVTEADITTPAGRCAVHELVAGADAFVHNWAPGRAERLGLDAPALWRTRPGLVHAAASGFGDAFAPAGPPLGTDYLAQVHSGLAAALRPAGEPPAPSLMTLTDVLGGLLCAQGVLTGLLVSTRTGRGARVDSSLLSAASLVPRPASRTRWTPLDVPLRTADGWLQLPAEAAASPEHLTRAAQLPADSPAMTAERFTERPTRAWVSLLGEAGVTATPVRTDLAALPGDPAFRHAVDPAGPGTPARPRRPWEFA